MARQWAKQRQIYYGAGVAAFILLILAPVIYNAVHQDPTCFDGKQNQGETAIDKGGPCTLLDENAVQPLSIMWARSFEIRDGVHSAVAYVENTNRGSGINSITYQIKLYSENSLLIAERFGRVSLLPGMVTPILETNIKTGTRKVVRTVFQFLDREVWVKMQNPARDIEVYNEVLTSADVVPTVTAKVVNAGVTTKSNVVFIATVFDTTGNAIATSRTFIERLKPTEERELVFTWPSPFTLPVARIDIVPLMAP